MKNRFFCMVLVCLILAACGSVPVARQIQSSFPVDQSFDKAWEAVIETFAELNLPIMNMEKASGFITTDWLDPDRSFYDCGTPPFTTANRETRGKFNVFVKKVSDALCEMKVNCIFELTIFYTGAGGAKKYPCVSTGKLEKEIYELVLSKTK